MSKSEKKYYTVWKGHSKGVFDSWNACKTQITNFKGAQYKAFPTLAQANEALMGNYFNYINKSAVKSPNPLLLQKFGSPNLNAIAVDAASSGNPGVMEYRGVDLQTNAQLFIQGPFPEGTNNIGEFLAIVHGLAWLKKTQNTKLIYTDSKTAMSWVKQKKCNTKLIPNTKNKTLFELIERATIWLNSNTYSTPIVKWETKVWGEIPADFGRK